MVEGLAVYCCGRHIVTSNACIGKLEFAQRATGRGRVCLSLEKATLAVESVSIRRNATADESFLRTTESMIWPFTGVVITRYTSDWSLE